MKKLLILYPHWPPSNLAGVHRARLISNFLSDLNWHPIVLTVHEDFYEEELDWDFLKTVRPTTEVIKVKARPVKKTSRLIGDIALRAFGRLKRKAVEIIHEQGVDFMWVPIPSFYSAIIARKVHNITKIPYGIDYIDPWVDSFVGQKKLFSKAWLSNQVAKVMEPYAVKKASLISGVDEAYYQPVLERNFQNRSIANVGMPYGFDPQDHQIHFDDLALPWATEEEVFLYAGAFLPKSHFFLRILFQTIRELEENGKWQKNRKLYFLGTGYYPGKQISNYSEEYGISHIVTEINQRFPFLHVLFFLTQARGIMVLGSTEKHYTASKIFQSLLSKRPVFGIFHEESSVVDILKRSQAQNFLTLYKEGMSEASLKVEMRQSVQTFFNNDDIDWNPDLSALDQYSAKASAIALINKIETCL